MLKGSAQTPIYQGSPKQLLAAVGGAASRMNMDPVQFLRKFYLTASTIIIGFNVVPGLQQRFVRYGARGTPVKDEHGKPAEEPESGGRLSRVMDLLASFRVPHSWFTHFYIMSVASSIFWGIQLVRKGAVFRYVADFHLDYSVQEPSMAIDQVAMVWILMAIQGTRRLYECITLTKPSTSKMGFPAYLLGILFYLAMGMVVWVEGIPSILANDMSIRTLEGLLQPSLKTVVGLPIFLLGSIAQNSCHAHLASLKKYSLPRGKLFRTVISPHYTSECVIYLGLAIVGAPQGQILNKTIATVLFFEAINLSVTAETTRIWYCEKFGAESVEGRWRIFPYVY